MGDGISTGWQQTAQQQVWLHSLSNAATETIRWLLQAEKLPAALFWAEYSSVRQAAVKQHWSPPPWQVPASVSEELYYLGLLAPADGSTLTRTQWVSLPADLRPILAANLEHGSGSHVACVKASLPPDSLPAA